MSVATPALPVSAPSACGRRCFAPALHFASGLDRPICNSLPATSKLGNRRETSKGYYSVRTVLQTPKQSYPASRGVAYLVYG